LIVTRTPLRVSLAGGGTDLAAFYEQDDGAVFSTAITSYIYVTVKRHSTLFDKPIRINYSQSEEVDEIDQIQNNLARECLRFLSIDPPIYVSTVGDHPASSGLGGSSSFTVGLLNALHTLRGERVSAGQLADEASHVEIDVLGEPIGKQDQYAAAFGGLNLFRFARGGAVTVEPLRPPRGLIDDLFSHLLLFSTGAQRDSASVLEEQRANTGALSGSLVQMRDHAYELHALASNGGFDPGRFGGVLDRSWRLKRTLASRITNARIDDWYERALGAGAEGGKLCGAGGGGCLLFIAQPDRHEAVRRALSDLTEIDVSYEAHGSQVVSPFPE
jgi:D-glycero-alpha-D-manno-heptose-7-phosphate kinase